MLWVNVWTTWAPTPVPVPRGTDRSTAPTAEVSVRAEDASSLHLTSIQGLNISKYYSHKVCVKLHEWMNMHSHFLVNFLILLSQMLMSVWKTQSSVPPMASASTQRDHFFVCVRVDLLPASTPPPVMVRCKYKDKNTNKHTHCVGFSFSTAELALNLPSSCKIHIG